MKKIILMTILFCGFIFAGGNGIAKAQKGIPPGSYQQSCQKIEQMMGANLMAQCRRKNGSWNESLMLKAYWECKGDITNQDGNLSCVRDANQPRVQNLKKVTLDSYYEVFGENLDEAKLYYQMNDVFKCEYCSQLYFTDKLTQLQTTNYFRDQLMRDDFGAIRQGTANLAIKTVYGRNGYPTEYNGYAADMKIKTAYFASIVEKETKKMNADKVARGLMILQAYKDAMGRPPTKEEREYWLSKTENYSELIKASRQWLYSTNGAKDLQDTVKKFYYDKNGKQPDEQNVKSLIAKFAQGKRIYIEMN